LDYAVVMKARNGKILSSWHHRTRSGWNYEMILLPNPAMIIDAQFYLAS
jgi:hypothetical protein